MAVSVLVPRTATRRIAYTIVLTALAVALSWVSIPVGVAKLSPTQHLINVLAAVLIGPWYGLLSAFLTSVIRNAMQLGTPLAFPGSMIGVVIAGLLYQAMRRMLGPASGAFTIAVVVAAAGEALGSGVIGATVGALLVMPTFMNRPGDVGVLIIAFLPSTISGSVFGLVGLFALNRAGLVE